MTSSHVLVFFFFFNDTATTEIYTLSLHDALPISCSSRPPSWPSPWCCRLAGRRHRRRRPLRRRRRAGARRQRSEEHTSELQSRQISYAVFCLKKKKKTTIRPLLIESNTKSISSHI